MKELTIEEKAKLYDEAVIRGSRLWESDSITRENYEYIFPELKKREEDERIMGNIIATIHLYYGEPLEDEAKEMIDWLKSLKERYTWKPSDEQMKLLREVQQALLGKDCHNRFVNFMYELKRLREE